MTLNGAWTARSASGLSTPGTYRQHTDGRRALRPPRQGLPRRPRRRGPRQAGRSDSRRHRPTGHGRRGGDRSRTGQVGDIGHRASPQRSSRPRPPDIRPPAPRRRRKVARCRLCRRISHRSPPDATICSTPSVISPQLNESDDRLAAGELPTLAVRAGGCISSTVCAGDRRGAIVAFPECPRASRSTQRRPPSDHLQRRSSTLAKARQYPAIEDAHAARYPRDYRMPPWRVRCACIRPSRSRALTPWASRACHRLRPGGAGSVDRARRQTWVFVDGDTPIEAICAVGGCASVGNRAAST